MISDDENWQEPEDQKDQSDQERLNQLLKDKSPQLDPKSANGGQIAPDILSLHLGANISATTKERLSELEIELPEYGQNGQAAALSGGNGSFIEGDDKNHLSTSDGEEEIKKSSDTSVDIDDRIEFRSLLEINEKVIVEPSTDVGNTNKGVVFIEEEAASETVLPDQFENEELSPPVEDGPDESRSNNGDMNLPFAPEALNDKSSTDENGLLKLDVLANDISWNGSDDLTLDHAVLLSCDGSVRIEGGLLLFDPGSNYDHLAVGESSTVEIDYTVQDIGGLTDTGRLTVTVTGSNDGPSVSAALVDQAATEDTAFSYQIPAGSFDDLDASDTLSYMATLSDGSALPGWLSFDASTRTFLGTPENGNVGAIDVKVTITDGSGATATDVFEISTANTNDRPDDIEMAGGRVEENAANGTVVGTATGSDVDQGDVLSYQLTDDAGGRFAINSTTGQLTVANGSLLDHEVAASHDVTIRVSDAAGATRDDVHGQHR